MANFTFPDKYLQYNAETSKQLAYVVQITGALDVLTSIPIGTRVLFGDPGITYGQAGLVYGGLRPYTTTSGGSALSYLDLNNSSLSINQRIEPETGKATVSMITLSFVDKDGYMTKLLSPGQVITEPMGAEVQLFAGYAQTSFPQDYVRIFRGYISQIDIAPGLATIQVSDANLKRRQQLFFTAKTTTTSSIGSTDTTIPVTSTSNFYTNIIGPNGGIDPAVTTYIQVENEWIVTSPAGSTSFGSWLDPNLGVQTMVRGARSYLDPSGGANANPHPSGSSVSAGVQLSDDPMSMALKIMLSGWNGPWITGVSIQSIGPYPDSNSYVNTTNYIVLPSKVDAILDYGLVIDDYVSIQGSTANPDTGFYKITGFDDLDGQTNRIIYVDATLYKEGPTSATISFRSQFDTYPDLCGLKMTPKDIDVQGHIDMKNTFLGSTPNLITLFVTDTETSGKDFIETNIYRPIGCYSVSKRGLLSVGITIPPLAGSELQVLNKDNITNAPSIKVSRMSNSRYFYNEIDFLCDYDDSGNVQSTFTLADSDSLTNVGFASTLSIEAKGLRTFTKPIGSGAGRYAAPTDAGIYITRAQKNFLSRFKSGSAPIEVKVTWEMGSQIEAGDVVQLDDNGTLSIANFENGTRDFGSQLLFVTERTLDLKNGNATLKLISSFNTLLTDRFATISPSSLVGTGSTTTGVVIQGGLPGETGSFGALYGTQEYKKWSALVGMDIIVHSADFSVSGQTVLTGFDNANPWLLTVSPALAFTPARGYIVELANYPSSTDPTVDKASKTVYAFLTPTVQVVSGIDTSNFTVSAGDIGKFFTGSPVRIHSADYTTDSGDTDYFVKTINLTTNQITLTSALSFTPSAGQYIDLIGFPDQGGPYRWV